MDNLLSKKQLEMIVNGYEYRMNLIFFMNELNTKDQLMNNSDQ